MGAHQSEVRFSGSYDPPLGSVGRRLDRLLLHQLAEATVRALLRQLVAAVIAEPATGPGSTVPRDRSTIGQAFGVHEDSTTLLN